LVTSLFGEDADITVAIWLFPLKGDANDNSDEVIVDGETLDDGFSNEAKISALSRYNEVNDEAAD